MGRNEVVMIAPALPRTVALSREPAIARRQVGRLLADAGWRGDVDAVTLAVHEALVNSANHADGVTAATAECDGRAVVVEVRDRGRGFAVPVSADLPDAAAERGRGLYLIRRLATDAAVTLADGEVCLHLRFEA